jgi:hypothetical protein
MTRLIFAIAGLLADHEHGCGGHALTEYSLCAALVKIAALALRCGCAQSGQGMIARQVINCGSGEFPRHAWFDAIAADRALR